MRVTALGGGVGSARLLRGLARLVAPERLTVIVNTADDEEFYGLHVSPDLDTAVYNLAGVAPSGRGWGLRRDSRRVLQALERFYGPAWFGLGDRDLATHLYRTDRLRSGVRLHAVTREIASAFGLRTRILPMTNDPVRTWVHTANGRRLPFQQYFVARRARDRVTRFSYAGLRSARPAPGVLDALRRADLLVFPPSNPFTSLLPILGLRGVRTVLRRRRAPSVAVSPIRGGRAVRGPLGGMLRAHGLPVSPLALARLYQGLIDGVVIDPTDRKQRSALQEAGLTVRVADIEMGTMARSIAVARTVLSAGGPMP